MRTTKRYGDTSLLLAEEIHINEHSEDYSDNGDIQDLLKMSYRELENNIADKKAELAAWQARGTGDSLEVTSMVVNCDCDLELLEIALKLKKKSSLHQKQAAR